MQVPTLQKPQGLIDESFFLTVQPQQTYTKFLEEKAGEHS